MGRTSLMLTAMVLAAAVAMPGCKKTQQQPPTETSKPDQPVQPKTDSVQPKPDQPIPGSFDHMDVKDARVDGVFPKSGTLGAWKKVRPVAVFDADKLGDMDSNAIGYKPYNVDWAANMMYQLGDQAATQVVVQLFHCASGKDAYGLLTSMSTTALGSRFGAGTDARGEELRLNINKGNYLLSIWPGEQQGQPAGMSADVSKLAQAIVDQLPAATVTVPDLIAAMPTGLGQPLAHYYRGGLWLPQDTADQREFATDAQVDGNDELLLADYTFRQSPGSPALAVQVFVIRYASEGEAKEAFDRFDKRQTDAVGSGTQLLVGGIKGACVYGTTTGDAYGLMEDWVRREHIDDAAKYPVMPTIESVLP